MPIWDWGVLKCTGCCLVPRVVLERETRCPSSAEQLLPCSLRYHVEMKHVWAVL